MPREVAVDRRTGKGGAKYFGTSCVIDLDRQAVHPALKGATGNCDMKVWHLSSPYF